MDERPIGKRLLWFTFFLCALAGLTACAAARAPQPMIEVNLDRPEGNSIEVVYEDGRALIDVRDSGGINGLNARLAEDEDWPEEIVVLLRLQGLEQLEINYGRITLTTGRSTNESPDPPLMLSVRDEQGGVQTASPSADIYYPDIIQTADGYEITLPRHFHLEGYPSFSMQWIDFYRQ